MYDHNTSLHSEPLYFIPPLQNSSINIKRVSAPVYRQRERTKCNTMKCITHSYQFYTLLTTGTHGPLNTMEIHFNFAFKNTSVTIHLISDTN